MFRDENNKLKSYDQILERLSQAIKDAQSIRDYSDQAVKSVNAK